MADLPQECLHIAAEVREKCRRAMIAVLEEPARAITRGEGALTGEKVRAIARANNNTTATLLRLWRTGVLTLAESWGEPEKAQAEPESAAAGLAKQLREAKTDADRQRVLDEAQALALEGRVSAELVKALAPQLRPAKQREAETEESGPADLLPATAEAIPLVEAFEAITGDARRKLVLEFALEQLERDRREGPQAITARAEGAKEAG